MRKPEGSNFACEMQEDTLEFNVFMEGNKCDRYHMLTVHHTLKR